MFAHRSRSARAITTVALFALILGLFPIGPLATLTPTAQAAIPTFASSGIFGVTNSNATDIQFADFDSDGDLDAVVAACTNSALYLNDGSGSFSASGSRRSLGAGCHKHLAIGDVDRDGDMDLVTANETANQMQIHRNNGSGQFTISNAAASGAIPFGIVALGDLNGDARLDMVVATESATNTYLGDANGTFNSASSVSPALSGATAIALGDMDSDGDLDLVTLSDTIGRVYTNSGGFSAAAVATFGGNIPLNAVALGDLDGNGTLDIVVGRNDQTGDPGNTAGHPVLMFQNDGSGTFFDGTLDCAAPPSNAACVTGPVTFLSTAPVRPSLGDIDDDGDLDMVVIQGPSGEVARVYFNNGSGNFNAITPLSFAPRYLQLVKAGLADLDGDYDLDFVALSPTQPSSVYRNSGSGPFDRQKRVSPHPGFPRAFAPGDMDADGDLDLVFFYDGIADRVRLNDGGGTMSDGIVFGDPADDTGDGTVADMDGDGDLDILAANDPGAIKLYLNNNTAFSSVISIGSGGFERISTADLDNNGRLDIIASRFDNETLIFFNDAGGFTRSTTIRPPDAVPPEFINRNANRVGDLDGDGDLDIVSDAFLFFNNGSGVMTSQALPAEFEGVGRSILGDMDGDGDLDIITGRFSQINEVLLNTGDGAFVRPDPALTFDAIYGSAAYMSTVDIDGDGDLDMVLGLDGFPFDGVFVNDGTGKLTRSREMGSAQSAVGDMDGDGRFDIIDINKISFNRPGPLTEHINNPPTISIERPGGTANAPGLSSAQVLTGPLIDLNYTLTDPEGDAVKQVLAEFSLDGGSNWQPAVLAAGTDTTDLATMPEFFSNNPATPLAIPDPGTVTSTITVNAPTGLNVGTITDVDVELSIEHTYVGWLTARLIAPDNTSVTLFQYIGGDGDNIPSLVLDDQATTSINTVTTSPVSGRYQPAFSLAAMNGKSPFGQWRLEINDGLATDSGSLVGWGLRLKTTGVKHTFSWDTFASGVFGQSDTVVLRMRALPSTLPGVNRVGGAPRQAFASTTTFPFRVRGSQVRVVQSGGVPAPNATVYRIPAEQSVGSAVGRNNGTAYTTDGQGFLAGRGSLGVGDQLIALLPVETSEKFTRYLTSAAVGASGPNFFTVSQPGVQTLTIGNANPLLAINLDVSLEWDARKDMAYLDQLTSDLRRSSELLYTWSDGQIALGNVRIFHDKENWATADVQIGASNGLRPNANQGGIVRVDTPDPTIAGLTYETGQIRMGSVWTRFGEASGQEGEDWPRAFAHELGHWALFLDEDYLGFGEGNSLITVEGCPGPMADPYRNDYGQFRADTPAACQQTLNQQVSGRSNWATIKAFYDTPTWSLNAPASFDPAGGPAFLPFEVTTISEVLPATSTDTLLAVPIFSLQTAGGTRYLASGGAKAILFAADGTRLTDLGLPERGEVVARGARIGDRLCVFDLDEQVLGCETISNGDTQLTMVEKADWTPELLVTPVTSSTYQLRVDNLPAGLNLRAKLYSSEGDPSSVVTLARSGEAYTAEVNLAEPILSGALQVWVEEGGTRREVVTDYALGGNPAPPRKPKKRKNRNAPALSPDGQVVLFSDNLTFNPGSYFAIQSLTSLPLPAPAWTVPVGFGYRLLASANAPSLIGTSLNMSYLEADVVPGTEGGIGMYYLPEGGTQWQRLATRLDPRVNEISAAALGPGTYVLMSSTDLQVGWNLLSYPWPEPTVAVLEGLELIGGAGAYTTIYGYDPSDSADPWKVYDSAVPSFVNDLTLLRYGRGYWVRATAGAVTAGLKQSATLDQAISPERPTTFYGVVPNGSAGQTVQARIGGTLCATTTTRSVDGQVVFVLDVPSAGAVAGCGTSGAVVDVRVNGQGFGAAFWEGERPQEIRLGDTAERRLYLPFIVR